MFLPRLLRPIPADSTFGVSAPIPPGPLTLVTAGRGAFVGEILTRLVSDSGQWDRCAWLRGPLPDARNARRTVIESLELRVPLLGCTRPWPPPTTMSMAAAFQAAGPGTILVVELEDRLRSGLGRLVHEVRELADQAGISFLLAPSGRISGEVRRAAEGDLVLDVASTAEAAALAAGLDGEDVDRVRSAVRSSDAVLLDLAAASGSLSPDVVSMAIQGPRHRRSYLRHLTGLLLDELGEEEWEALSFSVRTSYWHPQFSGGSVKTGALRPWLVPLEHDWGWIRPIWLGGLARELNRPRHRAQGRPPPTAPASEGDRTTAVWRPVLDVRLLGPFEVRIDGRQTNELGGQLAGSLLRYLLAKPHGSAHRDELIERFWPEADPRRARNRLQVAVSSLRKAMRAVSDHEIVEFHEGAYRLNPSFDVVVDYREFLQLVEAARVAMAQNDHTRAFVAAQKAVQLYRGPLCSDLPYEEWTIFPRERVRMMYGDVLEVLVECQWGARNYEGCIVTAGRMLDEDPCREDAHRLLMRSYSALGRQSQALRQYESCRRILKATLGITPSAATVTAYASVRSADQEAAGKDAAG